MRCVVTHIETWSKVKLSAHRHSLTSSHWWMCKINNLPWTQWFPQLCSLLWGSPGKETVTSVTLTIEGFRPNAPLWTINLASFCTSQLCLCCQIICLSPQRRTTLPQNGRPDLAQESGVLNGFHCITHVRDTRLKPKIDHLKSGHIIKKYRENRRIKKEAYKGTRDVVMATVVNSHSLIHLFSLAF